MPYLGHMSTDQASVVPEWTLQDRLRKARELTGLGQKDFAERLGVSRNTVGSAESGAVAVRRITMNAWAMATGVSLEWLETGVAGSSGPTPPDDGPRGDREALTRLTEQKRSRSRTTPAGGANRRYVQTAA